MASGSTSHGAVVAEAPDAPGRRAVRSGRPCAAILAAPVAKVRVRATATRARRAMMTGPLAGSGWSSSGSGWPGPGPAASSPTGAPTSSRSSRPTGDPMRQAVRASPPGTASPRCRRSTSTTGASARWSSTSRSDDGRERDAAARRPAPTCSSPTCARRRSSASGLGAVELLEAAPRPRLRADHRLRQHRARRRPARLRRRRLLGPHRHGPQLHARRRAARGHPRRDGRPRHGDDPGGRHQRRAAGADPHRARASWSTPRCCAPASGAWAGTSASSCGSARWPPPCPAPRR